MTVPANEFARPVRLDSLGGPRDIDVAAEPGERAALARRFGLAAVDRLEASASVSRTGEVVNAIGRIVAQVTQNCVATGDPLPVRIDAPFTLRFVPHGSTADEELELSEGDCDTLFYEGGTVDLGEAAAETLLLALDPFPRSPDADSTLREAGVIAEEEARPFSALEAALKGQLKP